MLLEQDNGSSPPGGNGVQRNSERLPHQQWQGRSTQFMRSNEHSRERAGVWNTQGLEGPALALVKGDEESGRWVSGRLRMTAGFVQYEEFFTVCFHGKCTAVLPIPSDRAVGAKGTTGRRVSHANPEGAQQLC